MQRSGTDVDFVLTLSRLASLGHVTSCAQFAERVRLIIHLMGCFASYYVLFDEGGGGVDSPDCSIRILRKKLGKIMRKYEESLRKGWQQMSYQAKSKTFLMYSKPRWKTKAMSQTLQGMYILAEREKYLLMTAKARMTCLLQQCIH